MQVLFISNDGAGFADTIEVADSLTVQQLFAERLPGKNANDYLIRVNRQPASADQRLNPNDRISMTPIKVEGALLSA